VPYDGSNRFIVQASDLRITHPPRAALSADLRRTLAAGLPEGTPSWTSGTRDVWDVVADDLTVSEVRPALRALAAGPGGELCKDENGNAPFHAAWSSALMAVNFLAPFALRGGLLGAAACGLGFERELRVAGVRSKVGPTVDAVLNSSDGTIGFEVKLAEPWRERAPVQLSHQYDKPAERVSPGTRIVVEELRNSTVVYEYLDAAQLVKHLLGIHTALEKGQLTAPARLVLLYWRPSDPGRHSALFERLESECADLAGRISDQSIELSAISSNTLLDDWSAETQPVWLQEHARSLRARYDRPLPS
jgi:hypothetical protein